MKFILTVFAIGFLLRIVIRYILPVFRITSMASQQMRNMQDQMNEMNRKANEKNSQNNSNRSRPQMKNDADYIDYEEVR